MTTTLTATRQARILYDGHCAFCRKSVDLLKRLDWFHFLTYVDARDTEAINAMDLPVDKERLVEEMHLVSPRGGRVYHGFGAFRWMAWRLPLLMPLAPLLYLPGVPTLGQKLYLYIAKRRFQLVPCHGGVCTLPRAKKDIPTKDMADD